jgi:protein O-mannosyl-transferase
MSRRRPQAGPPEPRRWQRRAALAVCAFLLAAVWLVFGQTADYGLVNYDDEMNLYGNPEILHGLSSEGIDWALTTTHGSQWAPVTWISYLVDYQLYGLKPGGYHVTNVLLHSATTVLLFLVLWQMTGRLWPSAFVAAVFAVHPLHVEAVAWVSERKGVLGGLFFVLTLGAYSYFVRAKLLFRRWLAYAAMLLFFALGLMSKPVLVTLPFILLLLDYWPLGRIGGADIPVCPERQDSIGRQECLPHQIPPWRLIAEKIPLIVMSAASCMVAPWAQGKAVISLERIPLSSRIGNALVSYVDYLGETFWPADLAVFYPHPVNDLPAWKPLAALLVLLAVTAFVLIRWRRNPYLPVGWFWYLGMLVPTIGLVQIGSHAMADRYMYLPQIGLCLAVTCGVLYVTRAWPNRVWVCGTSASVVIVVLMACAVQQAGYWHDSIALWQHALKCTSHNNVAHSNLAAELFRQKRFSDAIPEYEAAVGIDPTDATSYCGLGNALAGLGRQHKAVARYEEAVTQYEKALRIKPDYADAHSNLGTVLACLGRLDDAIAAYEAALKIAPNDEAIRYKLNFTLAARAKQKAE